MVLRISIEKFRCNLRWADPRTLLISWMDAISVLLIGWVDTVRVCVIRKRSSIELANRDLPEFLVEPCKYKLKKKCFEIRVVNVEKPVYKTVLTCVIY